MRSLRWCKSDTCIRKRPSVGVVPQMPLGWSKRARTGGAFRAEKSSGSNDDYILSAQVGYFRQPYHTNSSSYSLASSKSETDRRLRNVCSGCMIMTTLIRRLVKNSLGGIVSTKLRYNFSAVSQRTK